MLQLSSNIASKLNCSCRLSVICAESENSFFCLEFIPVILKWLPNKIQSETWRGFLKTWCKQWSETKGNDIQCVSIFVHLSALDRWPFELSVHRRPNKKWQLFGHDDPFLSVCTAHLVVHKLGALTIAAPGDGRGAASQVFYQKWSLVSNFSTASNKPGSSRPDMFRRSWNDCWLFNNMDPLP